MGNSTENLEYQGEGAIIQSFQEIQALMDRICVKRGSHHTTKRIGITLVLEKLESFFDSLSPCSFLQLPDELIFRIIVFYIFLSTIETPKKFWSFAFVQKYNIANFVISNAEMFYLSYEFEVLLYYFQVNTFQDKWEGNSYIQTISDFSYILVREKCIDTLVSIAPHCIVDDLVYNSLYFQEPRSSRFQVEGQERRFCLYNGIIPLWREPIIVFEWLWCLVRLKCLRRDTLKHIFDNTLYFNVLNTPFKFLILSEIIKAYAELDKISRSIQAKNKINEGMTILEDAKNILKTPKEDLKLAQRYNKFIASTNINKEETVEPLIGANIEIQIEKMIVLLKRQLKDLNFVSLTKYHDLALQNYYEGGVDLHQDNVFVLVSNIWDELIFFLNDIGQHTTIELERNITDLLVSMLDITGDFLRVRVAESQKFLFRMESDRCKLICAIARNFGDLDIFTEAIKDCFLNCKQFSECSDIKLYVTEQQIVKSTDNII
ncbi:hypothetical protein PAEPH01_0316 [Pancytospora epiphaga]|nr:hypothetical protein PAEPH01_0316 [Pancytospora epiphaga]